MGAKFWLLCLTQKPNSLNTTKYKNCFKQTVLNMFWTDGLKCVCCTDTFKYIFFIKRIVPRAIYRCYRIGKTHALSLHWQFLECDYLSVVEFPRICAIFEHILNILIVYPPCSICILWCYIEVIIIIIVSEKMRVFSIKRSLYVSYILMNQTFIWLWNAQYMSIIPDYAS